MKPSTLFFPFTLLVPFALNAQTLQTVTGAANGNTTRNMIQITGVDSIRGGAGLELFRYGTDGVIQAYDRSASAPNKLRLQPNAGSVTTINDAGTGRLLVNGAADDATTPLQVNGGLKTTGASYRAISVNITGGYGTIDLLENGSRRCFMGFQRGSVSDSYVTFGAVADNGTESGIYIQRATGNVGIGTMTPKTKLAVNGDIMARKLKVTVSTTEWADYVFQQDYKLPTLKEVEEYIAVNKHLQDIPSAKEVKKNGLDVGEMNKQLLQKVEELTLYLIAEHKKNIALEEKVSKLDTRLNNLECK